MGTGGLRVHISRDGLVLEWGGPWPQWTRGQHHVKTQARRKGLGWSDVSSGQGTRRGDHLRGWKGQEGASPWASKDAPPPPPRSQTSGLQTERTHCCVCGTLLGQPLETVGCACCVRCPLKEAGEMVEPAVRNHRGPCGLVRKPVPEQGPGSGRWQR